MKQALPRAKFNSSDLVRRLAAMADAHVPPTRQDFAERLGQWLDVGDAIAFFAAVNAAPAGDAGRAAAPVPAAAVAAMRDEVARVRDALAAAIEADPALRASRSARPAGPRDAAPDFAPFHRACRTHQRRMEAAVGPLRAAVRDTLAARCPALRPLAEIDAAWQKALEARERVLLSRVPQILERRFAALGAGADADRADAFGRAVREVLLAELETRLAPVEGLLAAMNERQQQEPGNTR